MSVHYLKTAMADKKSIVVSNMHGEFYFESLEAVRSYVHTYKGTKCLALVRNEHTDWQWEVHLLTGLGESVCGRYESFPEAMYKLRQAGMANEIMGHGDERKIVAWASGITLSFAREAKNVLLLTT